MQDNSNAVPGAAIVQNIDPVTGVSEPPALVYSRLRNGDNVIRDTHIPWLIDGVIHESGIGQLAAPEDTGKSIVALDLALSVANRLDKWAGYPIAAPGPVVYVAMEGGPVVQAYIDAWLKSHPGCDLRDFYLLDEESLNVTDAKSLNRFVVDMEISQVEPALVVFDTQIDIFGDTDEMSTNIGIEYSKLRRWLVDLGTFGLLLHHAPYDMNRGRGSTSIRGKCDVMAFLNKKDMTFEWQKIKGNKKPPAFGFQIMPVVGSEGAVVEWLDTAGLATTAGAQRGFDLGERDALTGNAILALLNGDSPSMLRAKNPTQGWSNAELVTALDAMSSRAPEDGGPIDVHTNKRFVGPVVDRLANEGLIEDAATSWVSGKSRQWRKAVTGS